MNERIIRKVIAGEELRKGDAVVIRGGWAYKIPSTINPNDIPELREDLECYWCGGHHSDGEVCCFAPYYIEETKGDNEHD